MAERLKSAWIPKLATIVASVVFAEVAAVGGIVLSLAPGVPVSVFVTTISFAIFLVCWAIGMAVTDREILATYRLLSSQEGVFVEPASASGVAGLLKMAEAGTLDRGLTIACTVTGHGLKDPDWAIAGAPQPVTVPADAHAAAALLALTD